MWNLQKTEKRQDYRSVSVLKTLTGYRPYSHSELEKYNFLISLFYWMPIEILYFSSVVWTFKYVLSLTLKKSHRAFLSCGTVYYAVQCGSNFCFGAWNPDVWSFKLRLMNSILLWYCLLYCTRWFHLLVFWSDLLMKSLSIA